MMREYLIVIFCGIMAVFHNYFSCLLRAIGNSVTPLLFLAVSAVMNIGLDLWFVLGLKRGVAGAAEATVISQYVSGESELPCIPGFPAHGCVSEKNTGESAAPV